MKKRPIIICLVVAILGSLIFWLQSNYIITGWLNGEAFCQGRPTSYWRRQLDDLDFVISGGRAEFFFCRQPYVWKKWLDQRNGSMGVDVDVVSDHPLWNGDPQATEVLAELLWESSSETVCKFAWEGLVRIKQ